MGNRSDRIAGAIEELPDGCRRISTCTRWREYQHHEIAAAAGCSIGTRNRNSIKAKKKMRDLLFPRSEWTAAMVTTTMNLNFHLHKPRQERQISMKENFHAGEKHVRA